MARQAGRLTLAAVSGALLVAAGPATPDPVATLAGRYSWHFRNGLVDGSSYWSDDVVEIVPVDPRHAYVRLETNFYNGHSCSLRGVAGAEGDALVYHDPHPATADGERCVLTLRRREGDLWFEDNDGGCKHYCGARGGFRNVTMAWHSRRPITYLARLRGSAEYQAAIAEWRTGKPAD